MNSKKILKSEEGVEKINHFSKAAEAKEKIKYSENIENDTVIINQYKSDGFLDFYFSSDLDEVMKVLNKIM